MSFNITPTASASASPLEGGVEGATSSLDDRNGSWARWEQDARQRLDAIPSAKLSEVAIHRWMCDSLTSGGAPPTGERARMGEDDNTLATLARLIALKLRLHRHDRQASDAAACAAEVIASLRSQPNPSLGERMGRLLCDRLYVEHGLRPPDWSAVRIQADMRRYEIAEALLAGPRPRTGPQRSVSFAPDVRG